MAELIGAAASSPARLAWQRRLRAPRSQRRLYEPLPLCRAHLVRRNHLRFALRGRRWVHLVSGPDGHEERTAAQDEQSWYAAERAARDEKSADDSMDDSSTWEDQ